MLGGNQDWSYHCALWKTSSSVGLARSSFCCLQLKTVIQRPAWIQPPKRPCSQRERGHRREFLGVADEMSQLSPTQTYTAASATKVLLKIQSSCFSKCLVSDLWHTFTSEINIVLDKVLTSEHLSRAYQTDASRNLLFPLSLHGPFGSELKALFDHRDLKYIFPPFFNCVWSLIFISNICCRTPKISYKNKWDVNYK